MRVLNVRMLFGVELILRYNDLFQQLLDLSIVDSINCAICEEIVRTYRDTYSDDFIKGYTDIANYIMCDSRINVTTVDNITSQFPNDAEFKEFMSPSSIEERFNISETYQNRRIVDESIETLLPQKYITISSKCLNVSRSEYENSKMTIFEILNESKIPVVILGEREVKSCKEYEIHQTYSIYEDLFNNLENKIDLTIASSENNNDLYPLKKTFKILSDSSLNIFISTAGVKRVVVYSSSNNVLGLVTTDFISFSTGVKNRIDSENITIVDSFNLFNISLRDVLNKLK
jgi:hypothetical protein